jgi:hypothetical protein
MNAEHRTEGAINWGEDNGIKRTVQESDQKSKSFGAFELFDVWTSFLNLKP